MFPTSVRWSAGSVNLDLSNAKRSMVCTLRQTISQKSALSAQRCGKFRRQHTLANGVTVNHVTGIEAVLPDGRVVEFGGKISPAADTDLAGFFVGRRNDWNRHPDHGGLSRLPESVATLLAIFNTVDDAGECGLSQSRPRHHPAALRDLDDGARVVEDILMPVIQDSGAVL